MSPKISGNGYGIVGGFEKFDVRGTGDEKASRNLKPEGPRRPDAGPAGLPRRTASTALVPRTKTDFGAMAKTSARPPGLPAPELRKALGTAAAVAGAAGVAGLVALGGPAGVAAAASRLGAGAGRLASAVAPRLASFGGSPLALAAKSALRSGARVEFGPMIKSAFGQVRAAARQQPDLMQAFAQLRETLAQFRELRRTLGLHDPLAAAGALFGPQGHQLHQMLGEFAGKTGAGPLQDLADVWGSPEALAAAAKPLKPQASATPQPGAVASRPNRPAARPQASAARPNGGARPAAAPSAATHAEHTDEAGLEDVMRLVGHPPGAPAHALLGLQAWPVEVFGLAERVAHQREQILDGKADPGSFQQARVELEDAVERAETSLAQLQRTHGAHADWPRISAHANEMLARLKREVAAANEFIDENERRVDEVFARRAGGAGAAHGGATFDADVLKAMGLPADADAHRVLGLEPGADAAQVRKAYRQASLAWHPDKRPGDTQAAAKFQLVKDAYDALSAAA